MKEWNFGLYEAESETLNPPHKPGETSYGEFFVDYGGESSEELQSRMNETLTNIMNTDEANTILAVSHGGALYMFYNYGYHLKKLKKLNSPIVAYSNLNLKKMHLNLYKPLIRQKWHKNQDSHRTRCLSHFI